MNQSIQRDFQICISVPLNLIRVVYNSLREEIAIEEILCWTDSFISLFWIRVVNKGFRLLVQNRVIKIRENVNASLWRDCDTKQNPADIITRVSSSNNSSENLSNNSIWWNGSLFLKEIKAQCLITEDKHENKKHEIYEKLADEFNMETLSKTANLVALSKDVYSIEKVSNIKNVSDVNKLFRLSAWVLRIITNLKKKCRNEKLNLDKFIQSSEINYGKILWLQVNQQTLEEGQNFINLKQLYVQKRIKMSCVAPC